MSDDHSPGDGRNPYSDIGGAAAKHAQTHDVRREELTNPTGPDPVDTSFAEQLAPDTSAGEPGGHVDESTPAADDKSLHSALPELQGDDLARLSILAPGTRLDQGATYLNLSDPTPTPFKAIGGQEVSSGDRIVAKRDTDYELWNKLVPTDADAEIERPVGAE